MTSRSELTNSVFCSHARTFLKTACSHNLLTLVLFNALYASQLLSTRQRWYLYINFKARHRLPQSAAHTLRNQEVKTTGRDQAHRDGDVGSHGHKDNYSYKRIKGRSHVHTRSDYVKDTWPYVEDNSRQDVLDCCRASVQLPGDLASLSHEMEFEVQVQGVRK